MKPYCTDIEKVENYNLAKADDFRGWQLHHRLETHFSDGTPRPNTAFITRSELIALDVYYHRPPEELIFMKIIDHRRLHMQNAIARKLIISGNRKKKPKIVRSS